MYMKHNLGLQIALFLVLLLGACSPLRYELVAKEIDTRRAFFGKHDIEVESSGSHVVLSGFVRSEEIRREVESLALGVRGVESVDNQLKVIPRDNTTSAVER
jgi:hypothetical protein